MKKEVICTKCKIIFLKRQDKISERNFCTRRCSSDYRRGVPVGNGEWAILGRKEYMRKYLKKYVKDNLQFHNERSARWALENKEKRRESLSKWQKNNKAKVTASANRRRSKKLQATPKWSNECAVNFYYENAKLVESKTGKKVHVDHIIPLNGKNVCGLHCEHNLRLMFAEDNLKKGQAFDVDDGRFTVMTHGLFK